MRGCDICNSNNISILLDNLCFSREVEGEGKEWKYRLLKCRSCGFGFVEPKPSWNRVCFFYDKSYGSYNSNDSLFGSKGPLKYLVVKCRYATYEKKGLHEIAQTAFGMAVEWITGRTVSFSLGIPLHLPKEAKIFDLGYGSGNWLISMSRLGYKKLAGYDIDANINNSSRLLSEGIDVSGGDFLENDYEESSYDCIRMNHVLEHLLQPREVLAKCYRMLKDDGILLLDCPCINSWVARISLKNFPALDIPRHLFHHTPQSVRLLLESERFDVVNLTPYAVPIFIPLCLNAVLNDCGIRLRWIKIPSFLFLMPFAPVYKFFCLLTHKGESQAILCRKRISNQ